MSEFKIRISALLGSLPPLAIYGGFIGHLLVQTKPYKLADEPLVAALETVPIWVAAAMLSTSAAIAFLVRRESLFAVPVFAALAGVLLSLAAFYVASTLSLAGESTIQASGDFGLKQVHVSFLTDVGTGALYALAPAFGCSALLFFLYGKGKRRDPSPP